MQNIENLLAKHFAGESSPEEDALVRQFEKDNPEEFKTLRSIWTSGHIEHQEFDTAAAWKSVEQKVVEQKAIELAVEARPEPKILYLQQFRKYAAILFVLLGASYLFITLNQKASMVEVLAKSNQEKVQLEDGSVVYLNNGARFSYPENFAEGKREVRLEGEAFFEVAKDANRPFIVLTEQSSVEVLGTSFNIDSAPMQTEVSVATGKVQVASTSSDESAILTPNQSAIVNSKSFQKRSEVDPNYLAWKTGVFNFENTAIPEVLEELNKYYASEVALRDETETTCMLSSTFDKMELTEIIEIIKLSCSLNANQKNESYELY